MALDSEATVVIVGASLAGLRGAETLRAEGHRGPIVMVGAEPHMPYDRPPLSKQLLAGTWGLDRVVLRPPEKIEALSVDLRLGRRATGIDLEGHTVTLDDGSRLNYDGALLATGAQPRTLADADGVGGVHTLRTLDDCQALAGATAEPSTPLVVIGAGFIGAEVAATCRGRGLPVTVLEALPVPLARVLGEQMGGACAALQREHGVDLRTGASVSGLDTDDSGHVRAVRLAGGDAVEASVVVVGIGVLPTTAWLEGSGLSIDDGVMARSTLHVEGDGDGVDDVVVAGDMARWFDVGLGAHRRIEHWTNAAEQGAHAARSLMAGCNAAFPYDAVPYFWSDQYDVKIQVIGHPGPDDEVVVVDGSVDSGRFVALYGRGGRLAAALGFGRPRQLMGYRHFLESRASFDEALAATPA